MICETTKMMLILKYGSMDGALKARQISANNCTINEDFTKAERIEINVYVIEHHPADKLNSLQVYKQSLAEMRVAAALYAKSQNDL